MDRLAALLIFSILLSSCAPTFHSKLGNTISAEQIAGIQIGKTTKAEILSAFGNPHSISATVGGKEIYKFVYMSTASQSRGLFGLDMQVDTEYQELNVTFKDDVVEDYSSTRR